jgi:hypothetical protein
MNTTEGNARTGLFRLWVVASLAWIGYLAWNSELSCFLEPLAGPWCNYPLAEPWKYYSGLVLEMVGLPILVGLAIIAGLWVVAGFKRRA